MNDIKCSVAAAFVNDMVTVTASPARLFSRQIRQMCDQWCKLHRLPRPTWHQLAVRLREQGAVYGKSNGQRIWRGVRWKTTEEREVRISSDADVLRRLYVTPPLLTRSDFCELAGMGRSTFFVRLRRGETPPVKYIGNRIYIDADDAMAWCLATGRHGAAMNISEWVLEKMHRIDLVKNRATSRRKAHELHASKSGLHLNR